MAQRRYQEMKMQIQERRCKALNSPYFSLSWQKVVLNISLNYKTKCPCFIFGEPFQFAAGSSGVQSTAWQGGDKSKLEVTGKGIDLILLTKKLKKKIGYTTIVTVEKIEVPAVVWHPMGFPQYQYYEVPPSNHGGCTNL